MKTSVNWAPGINYLLLTVISIVACFYFYISSQNSVVGWVVDDAIYLLMADYFSPYHSSLARQADFVMQVAQFPPLYPLLLALGGASSENLLLAHLLTTGCFISALVVYIYWVGIDCRNSLAGTCLCLLFICLPASLLMILDLWSEHLYILLTLLAFTLVKKAGSNSSYWLITSLVIGLIPLVRIVGTTFVLAYVVYLHVNKINNRYRNIALSIFPFVLWNAVATGFKVPQLYENPLLAYYQGDATAIIRDLFAVQLPNLWSGWHACFDVQKNHWSGMVCAVILLLVIKTWGGRLVKKELDSIYLLFYFILIWLWPAPDHAMRFMFVVVPVLLYYSYLSLSSLLKNSQVGNLNGLICIASIFVVLATCLPTNLYAINRLFARVPAELQAYRQTKYWLTEPAGPATDNSVRILNISTRSYVEAGQYVPPGKCVYSVHYERFMYYARRLAFPLPLPGQLKGNNIVQQLDKCEYIHLNNTTSHPYVPVAYPIDLLHDNFTYLMITSMSDEKDSPIIGALIRLH